MADWIWKLFGGRGVDRGMGVLDGVEIVEGKGSFADKCEASHCNQWGLFMISCAKLPSVL